MLKKTFEIIQNYSILTLEYIRKHKILFILILGLIIRILLMPFLAHGDIISTYKRAYSIAFEDKNILSYGQIIPHLIETLNLKVYAFLFDRNNLVPLTLLRFENKHVNFNLFFLKLPYLVFDVFSFGIIYLMTKGKKQQFFSLAYYFLNPILIFAVYIFGRYETIPIFFVLLSLYLIKNNQSLIGILVFPLAIISRTPFLLLLPFLIILTKTNLKKKILYLMLILFPVVALLAYKTIILGNTSELNWIISGKHVNFFFGSTIPTGEGSELYIFLMLYTLLIFISYRTSKIYKNSQVLIPYFFSAAFLIYYISSFYHPQYLAWGIPFISLLIDNKKNFKDYYFIAILITSFFPVLLTFWDGSLLLGIFQPISEHIGSISLREFIKKYYNVNRFSNIGKTFISTFYIIQLYLIAKNYFFLKNKFFRKNKLSL